MSNKFTEILFVSTCKKYFNPDSLSLAHPDSLSLVHLTPEMRALLSLRTNFLSIAFIRVMTVERSASLCVSVSCCVVKI